MGDGARMRAHRRLKGVMSCVFIGNAEILGPAGPKKQAMHCTCLSELWLRYQLDRKAGLYYAVSMKGEAAHAELDRNQLKILVDNIPPSLFAVAFGIVVMAAVFHSVINPLTLYTWVTTAVLVALFRLSVFFWGRQVLEDAAHHLQLRRLIALAATATGMTWGAASLLFSLPTGMFYWVFLAFFMSGYASGAVFSSSAWLPACAGYFFPTILPITGWFFFQQDERAPLMGMLLLVFTIAAWKMARNAHDAIMGRIEAQFRQQLAEQELRAKKEKVKALQVMAGGVAHDVNNTLAAVLGNVYLLKHHDGIAADQRRLLEKIENSLNHAVQLGRKMLVFSDAGHIALENMDIATRLRNLAERWRNEGRALHLELEPDLPLVQGDPKQFDQMVLELVNNAFESYEQGEGKVSLTARRYRPDREEKDVLPDQSLAAHGIRLTVRDQGRGMPREIINSMFDPFFSTKFIGRGLGLSSVYGIVKRMGGHLHVESQPEMGTVIHVDLPAIETS